MSPTVFREGRYRFFFFSREEPRVHVVSPDGEAKFWIEPTVSLATYEGLSTKQLRLLQTTVEERQREIQQAWRRHFGR